METKIVNLKRVLPDDVVIMVEYTTSKQAANYKTEHSGVEKLNRRPSSDPKFVPYENLNEEIVLGWLLDKPNWYEEQQAVLDSKIKQANYLENQNLTVIKDGIPWQQNEEQ